MEELEDRLVTSWSKLVHYYPQRVQVLVVAVVDFVIVMLEVLGVNIQAFVVGSINTLVLAIMVVFYGENYTSSLAAIKDWMREVDNEG